MMIPMTSVAVSSTRRIVSVVFVLGIVFSLLSAVARLVVWLSGVCSRREHGF